MKKIFMKLFFVFLSLVFLLLSILGFILPIMPGIVFLFFSVAFLSLAFPKMRSFMDRIASKNKISYKVWKSVDTKLRKFFRVDD